MAYSMPGEVRLGIRFTFQANLSGFPHPAAPKFGYNLGILEVNVRIFRLMILLLVLTATVVLADMPAAGTQAPEFTLTNNEGKQVSLKDFHGKWVVLYFYPKDFTSGCTIEAHNFQRDLAKYDQAQAVILGVSVDSAESHKSFCAKEGLNFQLLSDQDAAVSTKYGSVMDYNGAKIASRNTFLINPDGKIAKVFAGVKPDKHSEEVLASLASLKSK